MKLHFNWLYHRVLKSELDWLEEVLKTELPETGFCFRKFSFGGGNFPNSCGIQCVSTLFYQFNVGRKFTMDSVVLLSELSLNLISYLSSISPYINSCDVQMLFLFVQNAVKWSKNQQSNEIGSNYFKINIRWK